MAAWNGPFSFAWFVSPFYESNLAVVDYYCADAYNWLVRVQPFHGGNASANCICYSYLKASTGLSLDARHAGYNAKITLTPIPKPKAPKNTSGVNSGVTLNPFPPKVPEAKTSATTFAKIQPKAMPTN